MIEYTADLKELLDELDGELDDLDDGAVSDIEEILDDIIDEAFDMGYAAAIEDAKEGDNGE